MQAVASFNFILIEHSSASSVVLPRWISRRYNRVHVVNTGDDSRDHLGNSINCAFEFSGYQEGLSRVIADISSNEQLSAESIHVVIISNDTMFKSHINFLSKFLISRFHFLQHQLDLNFPLLVGIMLPLPSRPSYINTTDEYMTTWLFCLMGTREQLKGVRFFDENLDLDTFVHTVIPTLPSDYVAAIDSWLNPKNLFKGWYRALPFSQLDSHTYYRKFFAIYLEHTMPMRLISSGFILTSIYKILPLNTRLFLSLLLFFDRCYINLIKINYRLMKLIFNIGQNA